MEKLLSQNVGFRVRKDREKDINFEGKLWIAADKLSKKTKFIFATRYSESVLLLY